MGDRVLATHPRHRRHAAAIPACTRSIRPSWKPSPRWGSPDLTGALLISTCEPCPMCTGLAVWAGVTTIMYGSSIADTAAMGRSRILVGAAEIAERSPRVMEVIGGVLREECDELYRY